MTAYVLTTGNGLTRRLIDARDGDAAVNKFVFMLKLSDKVQYQRDFTPQPGEILVHEATEDEIAQFHRRRRKIGVDQLGFELPGMERVERAPSDREVGL